MGTNKSCSMMIPLVRVQIINASRLSTIIKMFHINRRCFLRMETKTVLESGVTVTKV